MWGWQGVLSLLALAWLLQCVGTWIQVRRYRAAFRELASGWSDGWMGAGKGGRFPQAGAIAMLTVAPDNTVRRVVVMKGRTVFAKAERVSRFEGLSVRSLRELIETDRRNSAAVAVAAALDQVERVRGAGGAQDGAPAAGSADGRRAPLLQSLNFTTSPRL
jgi:glucitol operon activator protein